MERRIAMLILPVVAAIIVSVPQTARSDAAAESAARDSSLEEIVVHARRRDEKLAEVPLAVSVVSAADLADQSVVLIEDALRAIPNTLAFKSARSSSARPERTFASRRRCPVAVKSKDFAAEP